MFIFYLLQAFVHYSSYLRCVTPLCCIFYMSSLYLFKFTCLFLNDFYYVIFLHNFFINHLILFTASAVSSSLLLSASCLSDVLSFYLHVIFFFTQLNFFCFMFLHILYCNIAFGSGAEYVVSFKTLLSFVSACFNCCIAFAVSEIVYPSPFLTATTCP